MVQYCLLRNDEQSVEIALLRHESIESTVPNWADVVGVYAIKVGTDEENPSDVTEMSPENMEKLREIFLDMNEVSYRTESETETVIVTDEYGAIVLDKNGKPITERKTTLFIYVNVLSMDYRDGADMYRFSADQNEMLTELMQPDYYPLFAELLGDTIGDGGTYGLGLDINPDLPSTELGAQIVSAAKKYIGRSYSSMDCSGLVRAAYRDCGLSSMNGLTSTGMAQKCRDMNVLFTDASKLQSGDLIFFARKDASRGEGYCTDIQRCGTGKCKRWMQIHHVAIYINGEFLIDSTGGKKTYIQSAYALGTEEKTITENKPFALTGDSFPKIIVRHDIRKRWYEDNGILNISVIDFLLDDTLV